MIDLVALSKKEKTKVDEHYGRILKGIWVSTKTKCSNKNSSSYILYGAHGIKVCEKWEKDFIAFYRWSMRNGFKVNLRLERKNEEKGFTPHNSEWISQSESNERTFRRTLKARKIRGLNKL